MLPVHMPLRRPGHASATETGVGTELSGLLEARSELAAVLAPQGTILCVGPRASELFGRTSRELCGAAALALVHPEDAAAFESQFRKAAEGEGEPCVVHWRTQAADGSWRALAGSFRALRDGDSVWCVVLSAQDAADRRHAERQLRRAQRMAALGELTGGVAHEFSNLLSVILCYNELALGAVESGALRSDLEEMHIAAERGASLVAQLLSYGRRNGEAHRSADLNHIVAEMVRMLSPVLDDRIRIEADLARDLHMVNVDPAQVEQVLLNLALNARDAMPYGGVIRIVTCNVDSRARLSFSDTGAGMDAETRARIFEPFFTTKPGGHGSGLGLATVRSIVHQHGGSIAVESEVGRGTTFHIYMPRAASAPGLSTVA